MQVANLPGAVYREKAEHEELLAAQTTLDNVRARHAAAAARWRELAEIAERLHARAHKV